MFISELPNLTQDQRDELITLLGYDSDLSDAIATYEEALAEVQYKLATESKADPKARNPRWFDESLSCTVMED